MAGGAASGGPAARSDWQSEISQSPEASELSTRERIVLASAEVFAERGYNGVNLTAVVAQLGLTKGALYFYFENKDALVKEIVDRHFATWDGVLPGLLGDSETYLEALVRGTHYVAESYRTSVVARAGVRLAAERNLSNAELPPPFVPWIDRVTNILELGKAARHVRVELDTRATAQMLVSCFYGLQFVSGELYQRADLHDQLDRFWSLVIPSLTPGG